MVGNEAVAAMVEHHAVLYADLADPLALLRGEGEAPALARYWAYAEATRRALARAQRGRLLALMSASQPLVAGQVLDAYPIAGHRCLLDVGGGQGVPVAAALRTPGLQPDAVRPAAVADSARAASPRLGLRDRAEAHRRRLHSATRCPTGADIASLVRVLYDHHDERAPWPSCAPCGRAATRRHAAGGRADGRRRGAERMGDAYFGMYLLAMGGGRARTAANWSLLRPPDSSTCASCPRALPLQAGVLVARRLSATANVNFWTWLAHVKRKLDTSYRKPMTFPNGCP
jgi:demethylspheroidene O-methyltransferase